MVRALLPILFFSVFTAPSFASKDSSSYRFILGLELQEAFERSTSFFSPTLEWEKGLHRAGIGAVIGFSYVAKAGTRGRQWVRGRQMNIRGVSLSYDLRFWRPSDRVTLRAGLIAYYFQDGSNKKKGDKDPLGKAYPSDHRALRRSWDAAPSIGVEFDVGSGFSLGLGFQPIRYRWSSFHWEGQGESSGSMRGQRFLLRKFEVKYRL